MHKKLTKEDILHKNKYCFRVYGKAFLSYYIAYSFSLQDKTSCIILI